MSAFDLKFCSGLRDASARLVLRFQRDRRAMAAVEFALILPLLLTMFLGTVKVSEAVSTNRRVVLLTRTLGDLTSQYASMTSTDLSVVNAAAASVIAPLSMTGIRLRITSMAISSSGSSNPAIPNKATVCWSYQQNWTPMTTGSIVGTDILPASLRTEVGGSVIMAEVQYPYSPVIGYVLTGTIDLGSKMFMRPRLSAYVERPDLPRNGAPSPITGAGPCT